MLKIAPMKRRSFPLWLLRGARGLPGSLEQLLAPFDEPRDSQREGALRPKKASPEPSAQTSRSARPHRCETRLRALATGLSPSRLEPARVIFNLVPASDTWDDTVAHCQPTHAPVARLDAFVEDMRQRYRIGEHGAANARSCAFHLALQSTSPALRAEEKTNVLFFFSNAQRWGRWRALARDDGGRHSRHGPPLNLAQNQDPPTSERPIPAHCV